jgi:ATP-binding cassette subfamily B protein
MKKQKISLLKYIQGYRLQAFAAPFFKFVEAAFELIVPLIMARIIDVGIKNGDVNYILTNGLYILILGVFGFLFSTVCQRLGCVAAQGYGTNLRNALFCHIAALSYEENDKLGTPTLINRLTMDINNSQTAVGLFIRLVTRSPLLAIGSIIIALSISARLSLIFLAAALIIGVVVYIILKITLPLYKNVNKRLDKVTLITRENLEGVRVVRAFSKEEYEQEKFEKESRALYKAVLKVNNISALINPLSFMFINFAILFVIYLGAIDIDGGLISAGQIIALINYLSQILLSLIVIANITVIFTKAHASNNRIREIFCLSTEDKNLGGLAAFGDGEGGSGALTKNGGETSAALTENGDDRTVGDTLSKNVVALTTVSDTGALTTDSGKVGGATDALIKFENVCYSYGAASERVLDNISFSCYAGQSVGIIGGTGSGKTTLINLLPRLTYHSRGNIFIAGADISRYNADFLRQNIKIVPQKIVLFSGSVRDNIKMGKRDATDAEIFESVAAAQAGDFIDDLDKIILTGAKNLSTGQKQRLTIARAIIGKPKILILDDSFTALDNITEHNLRRGLRQYLPDSTIITVSQRANAIRQCDDIIVLENGKILGEGTHSRLSEQCAQYREICLSQEAGSII